MRYRRYPQSISDRINGGSHRPRPDLDTRGARAGLPNSPGNRQHQGMSKTTPSGRVEITRPEKLLWPDLGITKQAYVDYLATVAEHMLPWLRDRPLSVIRAPDGVAGERYFQKNTPKYAPSWI